MPSQKYHLNLSFSHVALFPWKCHKRIYVKIFTFTIMYTITQCMYYFNKTNTVLLPVCLSVMIIVLNKITTLWVIQVHKMRSHRLKSYKVKPYKVRSYKVKAHQVRSHITYSLLMYTIQGLCTKYTVQYFFKHLK